MKSNFPKSIKSILFQRKKKHFPIRRKFRKSHTPFSRSEQLFQQLTDVFRFLSIDWILKRASFPSVLPLWKKNLAYIIIWECVTNWQRRYCFFAMCLFSGEWFIFRIFREWCVLGSAEGSQGTNVQIEASTLERVDSLIDTFSPLFNVGIGYVWKWRD